MVPVASSNDTRQERPCDGRDDGGSLMNWLRRFLRDEDGPTAVEYAVMLALILVVVIGSVATIGTNTQQLMDPSGQLSGALKSGS